MAYYYNPLEDILELQDTNLSNRVVNLENLTFKVAFYEPITTVSGQISKPQNSTILLNQWANGVDALICKIVNGKPDFKDSGVDVSTFDLSGNYTISASLPSNPSALIYYISIALKDFGNLDTDKIIEYAELSISNETKFTDLSDVSGIATITGLIPVWNNTSKFFEFTENILNYAKLLTAVQFKGATNNGSTNIIEGYNSDNILRYFVDTNGFESDQYDDVLPSSQWIPTSGGAAPDSVAYIIGGINYTFLSFDGGNTTEQMTNYFEIIHGINIEALNNDTLLPEIHTHGFASTNGSGNVQILIDITYIPVNAAPITYTPLYIDIPITINQQFYHKIAGVEFNKPAGGFNIGDKLLVRYSRVPQAGGDTYNADWVFMQCALHMPFNSRGSRQRYIK